MRATAEAGRALLGALNDDELARYGEIARDQAAHELERWWLQAMLAVAAVAAIGWAAVKWSAAGMEASGLGRSLMLALGLAAVLGYWPYRRARNWVLWTKHARAVSAEQARRRGEVAGTTDGGGRHDGAGGARGGA